MNVKLDPAGAVFAYCDSAGHPLPKFEFRFCPPRRFAFDVAWPAERVALEFEGGLYGKGKPCPVCDRKPVAGHSSIERIKSDIEKYNLAAVGGWRLLRCTPDQAGSGEVFRWLDEMFRPGEG